MAKSELPSPELLRKLVEYNPETGLLKWLARPTDMFANSALVGEKGNAASWNSKHAGKPAFATETAQGYFAGELFKVQYPAHRIAYAIHHGAWPKGEIDHINGDRADNRITNLRDVSRSENQRNAAMQHNNKSGVCGVHWKERDRRWIAQITDGKGGKRFLGGFVNFQDAVAARMEAQAEMNFHPNHGRLSRLTGDPA